MKQLDRNDIPEWYTYYRSHSEAYFDYEMRGADARKVTIIEVKEGYAFIRHFFGWLFSLAIFEKSDIEPSRELLARYGMKRGLVLWAGWKKSKPDGSHWWKLGYLFSHKFHYSTRSAFSVLDGWEYWKKWSSSARGHRNKIQKEISSGMIQIDTAASLEDFLAIYRKTKVRHGWKSYLIFRQQYLSRTHPEKIRIYLAYLEWECLAGAIFLDDFPTSTYLIAFQDPRGKSHHLGLALIDRWFSESQKLCFQFLDLDHMRDTLDPLSYAGYTEFKSGIADYELKFREVWMKVMI